jgi:hypothetical protein
MRAPIALLDMTAQRRRPTQPNGSQDAPLLSAAAEPVFPEESFAVPLDYIGDFKPWP